VAEGAGGGKGPPDVKFRHYNAHETPLQAQKTVDFAPIRAAVAVFQGVLRGGRLAALRFGPAGFFPRGPAFYGGALGCAAFGGPAFRLWLQ